MSDSEDTAEWKLPIVCTSCHNPMECDGTEPEMVPTAEPDRYHCNECGRDATVFTIYPEKTAPE